MINYKDLLSLDVETSGPSPFENSLTSVAAISFEDEAFSIVVNVKESEIKWGDTALKYFQNYQDDWERTAVNPKEAYKLIDNFLSKTSRRLGINEFVLVGQNIQLDMSFLKKLCFIVKQPFFHNISHRAIDTHTLLKYLSMKEAINLKDLSSSSAFDFFEIKHSEKESHIAINDAKATMTLFRKLMEIHK